MSKTAIASLESMGTYGQSRYYDVPKLEKESAVDYETRTWRERCHYNEEGYIFIPPMQFKKALANAASFLRMRIPGKGQSEYGKHFKAGVLVSEGLTLSVKKDEVDGISIPCSSNGKPGGGSRVIKTFPIIHEWKGEVTFHILDETITKPVFLTHLKEAGNFIGIGYFRPQREGYYGRFKVANLKWT